MEESGRDWFEVQPLHFPGGIEENYEILRMVEVPAEIRTRILLNTNDRLK
jgi:hypothetical protein